MIVSLFGPDGVGKSTIARRLAESGSFVFSGTGVASWPDSTWHNELTRRGVDEPSLDEDEHFIEKILRCHEMARRLAIEHDVVVIDSDPLHKTLMHDILKGRDRKEELLMAAYPRDEPNTVHLLLRLGDYSTDEAAVELQRRMRQRGSLAPFDPRTVSESAAMIGACDDVADILRSRGQKVIEIDTDRSIESNEIMELLQESNS